MEKTYHAIVRGWIEEEGVLDYALKVELDKIADKFASQEKEAQEAVTAYKTTGESGSALFDGQVPNNATV